MPDHPEHFFKYCTAHVGKIVLSTQTVRWNSPLNFDDPFDCYLSYGINFEGNKLRDEIVDRYVQLIYGEEEPTFLEGGPLAADFACLRSQRETKSRAEFVELITPISKATVSALRQEVEREEESLKREIADYRLFCVCAVNDNLVLWSNYADSHTGLAFQFECLEDLDVALLAASPVEYCDDAPALGNHDEWLRVGLGLERLVTPQDLWKSLVTRKSLEWEHEKEWRVIAERRPYENQGYEDTPFDPREISKVFLGCRMSGNDKKDILNLLTGPFDHVEAYEARQHPVKYQLDFRKIQ
jgi:hypothetical protein